MQRHTNAGKYSFILKIFSIPMALPMFNTIHDVSDIHFCFAEQR